MKFTELKKCPFCGSDVFYSKTYVRGNLLYKYRFDGEEADNSELYDCLNNIRDTGKCYCFKCNEYLGDMYNNTLSYKVKKIIEKENADK